MGVSIFLGSNGLGKKYIGVVPRCNDSCSMLQDLECVAPPKDSQTKRNSIEKRHSFGKAYIRWDFDGVMKTNCNEIDGVRKKVPKLLRGLEFLLE